MDDHHRLVFNNTFCRKERGNIERSETFTILLSDNENTPISNYSKSNFENDEFAVEPVVILWS